MAKITYQTYTEQTPMDGYRSDSIRRSAMCSALAPQHPELGAVAAEADAILAQIDTRRTALQQAEDDQVRARAIEDVEKLDVVGVYTELRRTMAAKSYNVMTLLPESPSTLNRLGAKSFGERADQAIANLKTLPDSDPLKKEFLPKLEKEMAEFKAADLAEDATRTALQSGKMALTLYKSELSQAREAQLGTIQKVFGDREKTALFTLPWRKASKSGGDDSEETELETPGAPAAP